MLIDFDTLITELAPETLDNLIREHLYRQISDEGFDQLSNDQLTQAMEAVKQSLKQGELVVEYAEANDSIAIKNKEELVDAAETQLDV